ncbi:dihydrofolate reductase [Nocardia terpenica]|uniref:dihydrofolate reductase n=1 Tax=Nocardia terpenica TaxID=455432 RepID=UPI000834BFBB|nr:dihydrofolate reductase [Nocardia terpenica]
MNSSTTETRKRTIGLVWSQTSDRVIAAHGRIPWRVPEDLAHFDTVTGGHTVVMGRGTWDALDEQARALPGRRTVVVTHDPEWFAPGAERAGSVAEALSITDPDEVWVIGGAEIFREAMEFATVIATTEIGPPTDGDVYAPEISGDFVMAFTTGVKQSDNGENTYLFRSYARV